MMLFGALVPMLFAGAQAGLPGAAPVSASAPAAATASFAALPHPPRRRHSITVPIPPAARGLKLPPVRGPADPSRPLVVIDPGHGGHDPGAINGEKGLKEKDVTLALALALRDALVAQGRVRVALTREDDSFLMLQERYELARRMGADLFLSIHADAADVADAHGATIYTLSETASDREAARLAARENSANVINGVDLGDQDSAVSSILIDLSQREAMDLSASFARLLYREAAPYVGFRAGYHRFASLIVLKAPDIPSALFEAGYISSATDAVLLGSKAGRERIAQGVAKAIGVYFARRSATP